MSDLLQALQKLLEEEYASTYIPATAEMHLEKLILLLGFDYKQRELKLEITDLLHNSATEGILPVDVFIPSKFQFKVILLSKRKI